MFAWDKMMKFPLSISLLFNSTRQQKKTSLDVLPNDVLVDIVFDFLDVPDLLALRQTSKLYFSLTQQPVIWKRLLQRTTVPLPPLPPQVRGNLSGLTGTEAERFLIRAYNVDQIWREAPEQHDRWSFEAQYNVAEMVMLPGGRYLVASVSDEDKYDWKLVVYVLAGRKGVYPIAAVPTKTRAYGLKAQFTTVDDERGIIMSYLRRDWVHRAHGRRGINISDLSPHYEINPPFPIKYEAHTTLVPSLKVFDTLGGMNPDIRPGSKEYTDYVTRAEKPFRGSAFIRSGSKLFCLCQGHVDGQRFIAVVKEPNTIIVKALHEDGRMPVAKLHLRSTSEYGQYPSRIRAIQPLPQQMQLLVVREITVPHYVHPSPITAVELVDIPLRKSSATVEQSVDPAQSFFLKEAHYTDVQITDHILPNMHEDDVEVRTAWEEGRLKPQPIHIFMTNHNPSNGVSRLTFYPRLVRRREPSDASDDAPSTSAAARLPTLYWRYSLKNRSPMSNVRVPGVGMRCVVLPSPRRTLLYTTPRRLSNLVQDSVSAFYRYHDPDMYASVPPRDDWGRPPWPPLPGPPLEKVKQLPMELGDTHRFEHVCFDETSGRIMFARPGLTQVEVLEFSQPPKKVDAPARPARTDAKHWVGLGLGLCLLATQLTR